MDDGTGFAGGRRAAQQSAHGSPLRFTVSWMLWRGLAAAVVGSLVAAASAAAYDPASEARNFAKTTERAADLQLARGPAAAAPDRPRERARLAPGPAGRPRAQLLGQPVRQWRGRLRRRPAALRLGPEGLRPRRAGAVDRAQRRHDLRPRVGHQGRSRAAAGRGDHQRLRAGRRADVLVRGADARQGRLRRADLGPAGAGAVRRPRRGAGRERGRAGPERRPPVLRRHGRRARLLPLHARRPVHAAPELRDGHEPRAQAAAPRGCRPQRGAQPVRAPARPRAHRTRRATPTAPRASPTSASGTRA